MSRIETLAARAGSRPDPASGALAPPLQLATTFEHTPDGRLPHGFLYQRYDNPTQLETEQVLAALEGARRALLFPTGMAAGATALQALPPGSHVLLCDDSYFSFRTLAAEQFPRWGLECSIVDFTDLDAVRAALRPNTALLWAETPSNPRLKVCDIAALAAIAHGAGARLLVDGTFAPPVIQQPLALGADIVLHSATKYLGGHGDVMGGVVACSAERGHDLRERQKLLGANLGPQEAWLALRGLKTLALRMRQHCDNAQAVAEALAGNPHVTRVNYPGLASHAQHDLARRLFAGLGFGGMLSFEMVDAGQPKVFRFMEALQLVLPATTLGDVYSLTLYPAYTSHRQVAAEVREAIGIGDGLVRLSVGIEDVGDIIADLTQALASAALD